MLEKEPLKHISNIDDLKELDDFVDDDDFHQALQLALKCAANPHVTPGTARAAMIQMQAWAFVFRMKGQAYMTIKKGPGGSPENNKKNIYFSISEQCHELAQSLKYISREIS